MDRTIFILWCLLGLGIALVVLLPLGPMRRASIPPIVWWSCLILGALVCMYGLSHSTTPTFAPEVTVVGKASAFVEQNVGRSSKFVFELSPENASPVNLETHIIVPHWGNAEVFKGRTLRIGYIDDTTRGLSNEAIDITILSGENAGWHDSLDARPFGVWLAIPIGAAIAGLGYFGIRYKKNDLKTIAAQTG